MSRATPRSLAALAVLAMAGLLVAACGGDGGAARPDPTPSSSPAAAFVEETPAPSPLLLASPDPEGELCQRLGELEQRLADLRAVELQLPNRVALTIELDKVEAAYDSLRGADFGGARERLSGSLERLGYRLVELDLAVEDFRTNPRPRQAAPHVEEEVQKVADEVAAFAILSRC